MLGVKATDRRNWTLIGGFLLIVLGLAWIIVDRLLRNYFPLQWDGPNIGGGALFLLACVFVLTGCAVVAGVLIGGVRGSRWKASLWVGATISVLLAAGLVVVLVVRPRDSTAGLNGWVGVTVSATGSPVLVLEICRGSIDEVTVDGPSRGSSPNEKLAHFHSNTPATTSFLFDLDKPPIGWTRSPGATLAKADPAALRIAIGNGPRNELRQADFTDADLRSLTGHTVQYGFSGEHRVPLASFPSIACP